MVFLSRKSRLASLPPSQAPIPGEELKVSHQNQKVHAERIQASARLLDLLFLAIHPDLQTKEEPHKLLPDLIGFSRKLLIYLG